MGNVQSNLYYQDNSGEIENEELSGFLKDLLELVKTVRTTAKRAHLMNMTYLGL